MLKELRPALMMVILMTVLTGLLYPMAMTGVGQLLFPTQAKGSLLLRDGKVVGSALIGQNFTSDRYFHGRPSATTDVDPSDASKTISVPYKADASTGSNLGPTSQALIDRVRGDVGHWTAENQGPVPVDLVTSSASGLDPDITPAAAEFQVLRVARIRGLAPAAVRDTVAKATTGRLLGLLGEPHINVLSLNLALDAKTTAP